ncbi:MAG: hypothetical protein JST86_14835 [Bacteroidetes bacterium]|nr:hypothetical protein [Bacteroidota bacterium]
MKQLFFIALTVTAMGICSCSNAFINQSMQVEKMGPCTGNKPPIKMNSNINGERYEFMYCLDEDFDSKDYTITRNGDSLLVNFKTPTKQTALFKITLDIDAKPAYHHIKLGDQTIAIVPTDKF